MEPGIIMLVFTFMVPLLMMLYVKMKVRGKMLCFFARKDKSVEPSLCRLQGDFITNRDRVYDVHPSLVRIMRYPSGWPSFLQELIPTSLYDEEDGRPMDWIDLKGSLVEAKDRSLAIKAALEGNWVKKVAHEEMASSASGMAFNWRKVLPIAAMGIGVLGLILLLVMS